MANFRYREGGRGEGLNAAYEMLLQAELAKAQAAGNAFGPLTDAIRSGQQMSIARDEQARLKAAQAQDASLRDRAMNLQERGMNMEEKQMLAKEAESDAFRRVVTGLGLEAPGGTPFQAPSLGRPGMERPRLSAQNLLSPGGMDPNLVDKLSPESLSRLSSIQNQRADNERQARNDAYSIEQESSEQRAFSDYLKQVEKDLPAERVPGFRARLGSKEGRNAAYKEIGEIMGEVGKAARENTEYDTYRTNQLKEMKKAYAADPKKMGEIAELETFTRGLPGTPAEKRKKWDEYASKVMGIGEEPKEPKGIDLPGIGMNINLNTSLDRREKGGAYGIDASGKVMGLSEAEAGELEGLVRAATERDSLFNDTVMMAMAGEKMPPEYLANLEKAREKARMSVRRSTLGQLGWEETDARWGGGESSTAAKEPVKSSNPSEIAAKIDAAFPADKPRDQAALNKFLEENFTPEALRDQKRAAVAEMLSQGQVHKGKGELISDDPAEAGRDLSLLQQKYEAAQANYEMEKDKKRKEKLLGPMIRAKAEFDAAQGQYDALLKGQR